MKKGMNINIVVSWCAIFKCHEKKHRPVFNIWQVCNFSQFQKEKSHRSASNVLNLLKSSTNYHSIMTNKEVSANRVVEVVMYKHVRDLNRFNISSICFGFISCCEAEAIWCQVSLCNDPSIQTVKTNDRLLAEMESLPHLKYTIIPWTSSGGRLDIALSWERSMLEIMNCVLSRVSVALGSQGSWELESVYAHLQSGSLDVVWHIEDVLLNDSTDKWNDSGKIYLKKIFQI